MKNKSSRARANGRAASISLLPRAIVCIALFVQVQVLVKERYYIGGCNNEIILQASALSLIPLTTHPKHPLTRRDSRIGDKRHNKKSWIASAERGHSLLRLRAAEANIYTAESNSKKGNKRVNTQVRSIMSILEERYDFPLPSTLNVDNKDKTKEWKKTRNYLYHASRSYKGKSHDEDSNTGNIRTLSQQVVSVLDFLDERLELPPHVSKQILQESPRILRKPVDSFLIPTADFLLQLWGRELFLKAVERNPALLLTSGVGYTTNRKNKSVANNRNASTNLLDDDSGIDNSHDNNFNTSLDQNIEKILLKRTGLSSSAIKRLKGSNPLVFGLLSSKVHSVLDFLDSILQEKEVNTTISTSAQTRTATKAQAKIAEEDSKTKKILGKLILAHPYLLNLSVESNLKPRVEFLAESCNLSPTQLAKVVQTSNGSVLGLSVEKNLRPTMDFLLKDIFYEDENDKSDPRTMLTKCILTHPQLLGLSIANMKSKVDYFRSVGPSLAGRIAKRCPAIYSLNLDQNIIPTIHFLAKVWGMSSERGLLKEGNTKNELNAMLYEYPNIITLSMESNLQPTMMFFNKTGYTLLRENWELISSNNPSSSENNGSSSSSQSNNNNVKHATFSRIRGRYIAASLYNRLLPRWHFCLSRTTEEKLSEKSVEPAVSATTEISSVAGELPIPSVPSFSTSSPKTPSLHVLVMTDDDAFCEAMGFEIDVFMKFKNEAIPRLKFSSQFDTWLKTGKPIDL